MNPEDLNKLIESLQALVQAQKNAPDTSKPAEEKLQIGSKPEPLDLDSGRLYLRVSDSTRKIFDRESEWLRNTGYRIYDRKPKAQVLLHILIHEFAKKSDEEKMAIVKPYMD